MMIVSTATLPDQQTCWQPVKSFKIQDWVEPGEPGTSGNAEACFAGRAQRTIDELLVCLSGQELQVKNLCWQHLSFHGTTHTDTLGHVVAGKELSTVTRHGDPRSWAYEPTSSRKLLECFDFPKLLSSVFKIQVLQIW